MGGLWNFISNQIYIFFVKVNKPYSSQCLPTTLLLCLQLFHLGGTTNTGSGPRVLASDHKFSDEKDAAYWRTQMVEVVLKEAMAKVGMRMEWLEKYEMVEGLVELLADID